MWFRKQPQKDQHEEFHEYTEDLIQLAKLRQQAMQRNIVQPSADNAKEVDRYDTMIAGAQKVLLRLTRDQE